MSKEMSRLLEIVIYVLCGIAGSVILGAAVYGKNIFSSLDPPFFFLSLGVIGACTLALVRFSKLWIAAVFVLAAAIVMFIVLKMSTLSYKGLLFFVFFYLVAGYVFFGTGCLFRTKVGKLPIGKFLIIVLFLVVLFRIKTLAFFLLFKAPVPMSLMILNVTVGALIGCGLGIGIEAGELLGRLFRKSDQNILEPPQA